MSNTAEETLRDLTKAGSSTWQATQSDPAQMSGVLNIRAHFRATIEATPGISYGIAPTALDCADPEMLALCEDLDLPVHRLPRARIEEIARTGGTARLHLMHHRGFDLVSHIDLIANRGEDDPDFRALALHVARTRSLETEIQRMDHQLHLRIASKPLLAEMLRLQARHHARSMEHAARYVFSNGYSTGFLCLVLAGVDPKGIFQQIASPSAGSWALDRIRETCLSAHGLMQLRRALGPLEIFLEAPQRRLNAILS